MKKYIEKDGCHYSVTAFGRRLKTISNLQFIDGVWKVFQAALSTECAVGCAQVADGLSTDVLKMLRKCTENVLSLH